MHRSAAEIQFVNSFVFILNAIYLNFASAFPNSLFVTRRNSIPLCEITGFQPQPAHLTPFCRLLAFVSAVLFIASCYWKSPLVQWRDSQGRANRRARMIRVLPPEYISWGDRYSEYRVQSYVSCRWVSSMKKWGRSVLGRIFCFLSSPNIILMYIITKQYPEHHRFQ